MESIFKLVKFSLLLVKVLNKAASTLLHLIKSALEAHPEWSDVLLALPDLVVRVLRMPDIVSNEFLKLSLPRIF